MALYDWHGAASYATSHGFCTRYRTYIYATHGSPPPSDGVREFKDRISERSSRAASHEDPQRSVLLAVVL